MAGAQLAAERADSDRAGSQRTAGERRAPPTSSQLIQDLVLDRLLQRVNLSGPAFRALLAEAVDGSGNKIGQGIWEATSDHFRVDPNTGAFTGGMSQPEVMFPRVQQSLPGLQ
jgi:hypothetical protein